MTTRQKFWLKVALTATFPVWCLPVCVAAMVAFFFSLAFAVISDAVDDFTK